MKINIAEITKSFKPRYSFLKADKYMRLHGLTELNNDELYSKLEKLTLTAIPSFKDQWDTRWKYFYFPLKWNGKLVCNPFSVTLHNSIYSIAFYGFTKGVGFLAIDKGNDKVPEYFSLVFDEALRFIPLLKEKGSQLIEQTFPYDWRQGKVKRKYIRESHELISHEEKEKIETAYKKHMGKKLAVSEISLNDYLNTAAICYRAAYEKEIKDGWTPRDMRQRWADMRHGGMMHIENPDSKKEFMEWLNSKTWKNAHPFEIVFSMDVHGIVLYPPDQEHSFYRLTVTDIFYIGDFVRMVASLVEHNIPFEAYGLESALDYLTGESFVDVNPISMAVHGFTYESSREYRQKYFPYIDWDEIKMLQWSA